WTQQTLQLQRPAPAEAEREASEIDSDSGPQAMPARPLRTGASLGNLARRVQRQEQQGAMGTFGCLAGGVERAERFAVRIASHFPAMAAKYEAPPPPEPGAAPQPAAPSAPSFTYYPEGSGSSGSSASQPTMTAAEVLKQFGNSSNTTPVQ